MSTKAAQSGRQRRSDGGPGQAKISADAATASDGLAEIATDAATASH